MLIPLHLIPVPADEPRGLGDPGHAWSGLKIAEGVRLGDCLLYTSDAADE